MNLKIFSYFPFFMLVLFRRHLIIDYITADRRLLNLRSFFFRRNLVIDCITVDRKLLNSRPINKQHSFLINHKRKGNK